MKLGYKSYAEISRLYFQTDKLVQPQEGQSNGIISTNFHPYAPLLSTGSNDETEKLWRVSPGLSRQLVLQLCMVMGPLLILLPSIGATSARLRLRELRCRRPN